MFQSPDDYLIPIMKLLNQLPYRSGKAEDVVKLFGKTYNSQIPKEQFTSNASGNIRWEHRVRWARESLKELGFLDAPAHGIWRLTDAGEQWLVENPKSDRIIKKNNSPFSNNKPDSQNKNTERNFKENEPQIRSCAGLQSILEEKIEIILGKQLPKYRIHCRNINCIQIHFDDFGGCHYEMSKQRTHFNIALHFESTAEKSLERNKAFDPYLLQIEQIIGERIKSGPLESRGWMRLWLEQLNPVNENCFSKVDIENYTNLMVVLIRETYPILANVYRSENIGKTKGKVPSTNDLSKGTSQEYLNLNKEIEAIHNFLQGRSASRPNDEKLCDWINFCYLIGLYREGRELFALVSQENTNPWYFEKVKKLAHLCEMKASIGSQK